MEADDSEIPWMDDGAFSGSTGHPDVIGDGGKVTLAVFLIAAVITIVLLFALGIFIDCMHQKLDDEEAERRRVHKLRFPKLKRPKNSSGDKDCIISDMEINEASTSNGIV